MALTNQYYWPVATPGTTTPPASSSAPPTNPAPPSTVRFNEVAVQLSGDGAATSLVVTHNLGITAGELAQLWPEVRFEPTIAGGIAGFWVEARAANTVTVGFTGTAVGAYGLLRITRPQSITR